MDIESIWEEKYRPKTLDGYLLDDDTKALIQKYKDSGDIPHICLIGKHGIGKTTLARIIANDILNYQYLYINASSEKGIDVIRDDITRFAQTASMYGKHKIVILDEADGLTPDAQKALRGVMDEYVTHTRFIFTGNFKNKIIEPLISRCVTIDLKPKLNDVIKHCISILQKENIQLDKDAISKTKQLVEYYYPDIRKSIQELNRNIKDNKLVLPDFNRNGVFAKKFVDFILDCDNTDVVNIRKYMMNNTAEFKNDYNALLHTVFNELFESNLDNIKKMRALTIISEYLYRSEIVMDKEINAFSCILSIKTIL